MLLGSPAGPNGTSVKTFVFFDEGSSVSLMDPTLIEELGLAGEAKPLTRGATRSVSSIPRTQSRCHGRRVRNVPPSVREGRG